LTKPLETKDLRSDVACYYNNISSRVFPTRALDSRLIIGNPSIAKRYKEKIIEELRDNAEGKKRYDKFDAQARYHFRFLREDKKQESFIESEGILFYDGIRSKSTKYTHLRSIQYKIALDIFRAIKRNEIGYDFLSNFPLSIVDRLNYLIHLKDLSNISTMEADDVISAYNKAMYWYHLSEENFKLNEQIILNVNPYEFKEVTKITRNFIRRPSIFSSQLKLF